MYNYLINFQPSLLGAPLQLGALSARLVLWVNPALLKSSMQYGTDMNSSLLGEGVGDGGLVSPKSNIREKYFRAIIV